MGTGMVILDEKDAKSSESKEFFEGAAVPGGGPLQPFSERWATSISKFADGDSRNSASVLTKLAWPLLITAVIVAESRSRRMKHGDNRNCELF